MFTGAAASLLLHPVAVEGAHGAPLAADQDDVGIEPSVTNVSCPGPPFTSSVWILPVAAVKTCPSIDSFPRLSVTWLFACGSGRTSRLFPLPPS